MAETISRAEAAVYLLLRRNRLVWFDAARIAKDVKVSIRTVQRCMSRLVPLVVTRYESRPAPRFSYGIMKGRSAADYSQRLEQAVDAYGLEKKGRTG